MLYKVDEEIEEWEVTDEIGFEDEIRIHFKEIN